METRSKLHRDGTVTVWDTYAQQWLRTRSPSERVLASLTEHERARVQRHVAKWARFFASLTEQERCEYAALKGS